MDQLPRGTQISCERRDSYQDIGSSSEKRGHGRREAQEKSFSALQMGHCPLARNSFHTIYYIFRNESLKNSLRSFNAKSCRSFRFLSLFSRFRSLN
jgi:hypothetical protein